MTPDDWKAEALRLIDHVLDAPWALGDWLTAAEPTQLDLVDARTEILNSDPRFEYTELAHYGFVAERIPPSRRHPLPWSYHAQVARLPDAHQDQLLEVALIESWSLTELRTAVRETQKEISP